MTKGIDKFKCGKKILFASMITVALMGAGVATETLAQVAQPEVTAKAASLKAQTKTFKFKYVINGKTTTLKRTFTLKPNQYYVLNAPKKSGYTPDFSVWQVNRNYDGSWDPTPSPIHYTKVKKSSKSKVANKLYALKAVKKASKVTISGKVTNKKNSKKVNYVRVQTQNGEADVKVNKKHAFKLTMKNFTEKRVVLNGVNKYGKRYTSATKKITLKIRHA